MDYDSFIETFSDQPIVESAAVVTLFGDRDAALVQLSRWVASGKLIKLRRGYYLIAQPFRKREPNLHYLANILCRPSYISLVYALGYYGLIPEAVHAITSVTVGRPQHIRASVGRFDYRHVSPRLFWGYRTQEPLSEEPVQIAEPEKALLDMIYLTPGASDEAFFESLRLQHTEVIDLEKFADFASRFRGAKMRRAVESFRRYAEKEREGEVLL